MSASTLAALGYAVVAASGPTAALEALEADPEIALLLSDVVLGGSEYRLRSRAGGAPAAPGIAGAVRLWVC